MLKNNYPKTYAKLVCCADRGMSIPETSLAADMRIGHIKRWVIEHPELVFSVGQKHWAKIYHNIDVEGGS